jgi:hypothetical protein
MIYYFVILLIFLVVIFCYLTSRTIYLLDLTAFGEGRPDEHSYLEFIGGSAHPPGKSLIYKEILCNFDY